MLRRNRQNKLCFLKTKILQILPQSSSHVFDLYSNFSATWNQWMAFAAHSKTLTHSIMTKQIKSMTVVVFTSQKFHQQRWQEAAWVSQRPATLSWIYQLQLKPTTPTSCLIQCHLSSSSTTNSSTKIWYLTTSVVFQPQAKTCVSPNRQLYAQLSKARLLRMARFQRAKSKRL